MGNGDKVVCIDNEGTPLVKGELYIVDEVSKCKGCGVTKVTVGIFTLPHVTCCGKCNDQEFSMGDMWFRGTRFAKWDEAEGEEFLEQMKEVLQEEEVRV